MWMNFKRRLFPNEVAPELCEARAQACAAVINDTIYVMGGRERVNGPLVREVECFRNGRWKEEQPMNTARYSSACAVLH